MTRGLIAVLAAQLLASEPALMTPADLFLHPEVAEIQPSPDGQTILFTSTQRDPKSNRSQSRLMRVAVQGGAVKPLPGALEGAANVRWSPDGRRIAFLATKDSRQAVWTLEMSSGRLTRVSDYDRPNGFFSKAGSWLVWSPDSSELAFAGTREPKPPVSDPLVIRRILYKTRTGFSDNRRSHVYVVAASGGAPRQLTQGDFDEHSIAWGGDGREIVFLSNREPDPDANHNYDLFAVNVSSSAVRRLTETPGVEMDPAVSPDGLWIAYTATKRARTTIDSVAEDAHVWVIPYAGGRARELNTDLDRRSASPVWTPDSRSILFLASDRGKSVLYRVPVEGGVAAAVVDRTAQVSPFNVAARTGAVAFGLTDTVTPRQLYVLDSGEPRRLATVSAEQSRRLSTPEPVRFESFDGTPVEGWIYLPPAGSARPPFPLILAIHGGPHGMYGYSYQAAFQIYAARGYAVLALNPRGSTGYGQRFSDGCVNDWGGGDYKDLMAGVDATLKKYPVDPARLGVTGGSYGGYMTNWVVTQTGRFRAAVTVASLSNLISFYATSLYQDLIDVEFGRPWEGANFETLWRQSPLKHIARVRTPTLLLHGENDNDVHITQAEEMYTALRLRGVDSVLVRYPREGHGFREPKHQIDALTRTLEWMDRYLK